MLRLLLICCFPIIDLATVLIFADDLGSSACTSALCPKTIIGIINILCTWSAIYFAIFLLALAVVRLPGVLLRAPFFVLLGTIIFGLIYYALFSWGFTITNGFPPSPDAVASDI